MQTRPDQIKRQQEILTYLGFYQGKIDGIWGKMSIDAKKAWERTASFIPASPSNGLPFGDKETLPAGMKYDRATQLFTFKGITQLDLDKMNNRVEANVPVAKTEQPATQQPATSLAAALAKAAENATNQTLDNDTEE